LPVLLAGGSDSRETRWRDDPRVAGSSPEGLPVGARQVDLIRGDIGLAAECRGGERDVPCELPEEAQLHDDVRLELRDRQAVPGLVRTVGDARVDALSVCVGLAPQRRPHPLERGRVDRLTSRCQREEPIADRQRAGFGHHGRGGEVRSEGRHGSLADGEARSDMHEMPVGCIVQALERSRDRGVGRAAAGKCPNDVVAGAEGSLTTEPSD
jgi:hypothetical protein